MQISAQKKRKFWLGIVISMLCLGGMFWLIRPSDMARMIQQANPYFLLWTAFYLMVYLLFRAVRWRFLLGNRVAQGNLFHIQNIGQMLTQLLPFRLGDVARAMLVGQQPGLSIPQGLTTMVVERVMDMLLMVLLLPVALLQVPAIPGWLQQAALLSGGLVLVLMLILIVLANKRPLAHRMIHWLGQRWSKVPTTTLHRRSDDFLDGLQVFTQWRAALALVGLTLLTWLPVVLAYSAALTAVQLEPSFLNATFIMIVGAFAVAAPSSPGQIGVFHMGVIAAMTALGQPGDTAASLAVLYHALNFLVMVLLGVIGLFVVNVSFQSLTSSLGFGAGSRSTELTGRPS